MMLLVVAVGWSTRFIVTSSNCCCKAVASTFICLMFISVSLSFVAFQLIEGHFVNLSKACFSWYIS